MAYELIKNHEYNSTEVKFDGVPSKATREALKQNGFKWHKTKGVWYGRKTIEETTSILNAGNVAKIENNSTPDNIPTAETKPFKIYYNGIKPDGDDLIKCNYYMCDNGCIRVIVDSILQDLPRDIFPNGKNDTQPYADYSQADYMDIEKTNPLYKYFFYAWAKMKAHDAQQGIKRMTGKYARYYTPQDIEKEQAYITAFANMENPGHPTNIDLLEVDKMKEDVERAKKEAQEAKEKAREEKYKKQKEYGENVIKTYSELYPYAESDLDYAVVEWSEHPAFYDNNRTEEDGGGKYTIKALENILKDIDNYEASEAGYYKTKFKIIKDGEQVYEGRYDLGDGENGMYKHMINYQKYWFEKAEKTEEEKKEFNAFFDWLAEKIA